MKILFLLNSLGSGGTERSTAYLLPALRDLGFECEVAVLKSAPEGFEDEVTEAGFAVHHLPATNPLGQIRAFRSLVRRTQPEVVHTAIFEADVIGRIASWRTSARVVSSLVNTPYDPARRADSNLSPAKLRLVQAIDGWTARHFVDRFHAVSAGVKAANVRHLRLDPSLVDVVERGRPTWPDLNRARCRSTLRDELALAEDATIVLSVGRVEFQKDHATLVQALALLAERGDDRTVAVIAGRHGAASQHVRSLSERLGVARSVHLLGHRSDIAELFAAADMLALPSRYEGTAGVVIEAMAAGVPVIASDLEGLQGILEDGTNATLIPSAQPELLAAAIEKANQGDPLFERQIAVAKRDFATRFGLTQSAARMAALYNRVVDDVASG